MNNLDSEKKEIFSFDRNFSANIFYKQPDKYREIEKLSKTNENLISSGSSLSYSPLAFGKNILTINLKRFNRIIDFNLKNKQITVEAGITLAELLTFTLKHNLWFPQLPGYPFITLGGALATNAHGKSCGSSGTIRNSVKEIKMFHNQNGWLNLSKDENKEIFDLTIGGLGLTGTIINITLKLETLQNKNFLTTKNRVSSIKECIDKIKSASETENTFAYSWNIGNNLSELGKGFVFQNVIDERATKDDEFILAKKYEFFKPSISLWNKSSINLINNIFYNFNKFSHSKSKEKFTKVIFPFYGKENYFNFFGKKGLLESQLLISEKNIYSFFDEFKYLHKNINPSIALFSFKNMKGDLKFLRFEGDKVCVTFDYPNNKTNLLFMKEVDKLCIKYEIQPSIIKDSRLDRDTVQSCYSDYEKFKKQLYNFDKKRTYKSETSQRLAI